MENPFIDEYCSHPNMHSTARRDYCPDCNYEFYYGDVHAKDPELKISKEVRKGRHKPYEETPNPWEKVKTWAAKIERKFNTNLL